jgi:hypothetical protein
MKKLLKPLIGLAIAAGFLMTNINLVQAKTSNVSNTDVKVQVETELAESGDWYALFGSGYVLVIVH